MTRSFQFGWQLLFLISFVALSILTGCNQHRYEPAQWRAAPRNSNLSTTLPGVQGDTGWSGTTLPSRGWTTLPGRQGTTLPNFGWRNDMTTLPNGGNLDWQFRDGPMTTLPRRQP